MQPYKIKNYPDCVQYVKGGYEKNVFKFLMESTIIDKSSEAFDDIRFAVRKMSPAACVAETLESPNVILVYHANPLPRAFKVFAAKDLKSGDKKLKVFIDMSDLISTKTGVVTVAMSNIDKLVSFLTSALLIRIYYGSPDLIYNNSNFIKLGTSCFANLFSYIIDYLHISGVDRVKEKTTYLSSIYYNMNIMGREYTESVESIAKQISKISLKDIELLDIAMPADAYTNIEKFIEALSKVLKADGLKFSNFLDTWVRMIGVGTHFGLEYYPAFSTIITNVYNGSYLVSNQKLVDKICGKDIVAYTKTLLSIGDRIR